MDEIEFNYIGEEEALDIDDNLNDDYEVRTLRVNKDGKKIRGKDLSWVREAFKKKNNETYGNFHMLVYPPPNKWKITIIFLVSKNDF